MLKPIEILVAIVSKLRAPDGCAWDREQTHQSLRSGLVEECCEVIDAIDSQDFVALQEELGDLLLHVVFHSQIAKESGHFDFEKVCATIVHKMIARHPHVFRPFPQLDGVTPMAEVQGTKEILSQWEKIKRKEKSQRTSVLDGLAKSLPSLLYAQKLQSKAANLGLDWPDPSGPMQKVREELAEVEEALKGDNFEEELGDVLFAVVNLCRKLGVDAEGALKKANKKFEDRFRRLEKMGLEGKTPEEVNQIWERIKLMENV